VKSTYTHTKVGSAVGTKYPAGKRKGKVEQEEEEENGLRLGDR
jgi:hypothetical protein